MQETAEADALRRKLCGTRATPDQGHASPGIDPDKAAVLRWAAQLAADGRADCDFLDNGDIRLRLNTGELFQLGKTHVTRLA
jgi:hypothetical protein